MSQNIQVLERESAATLEEQAVEIEDLLPRLARRLFTVDSEPVTAQLPVAQLRVLTILRDGPRSMSAVSEELGISVSAITQMAARLERIGLVERVVHERDRRMRILRLTEFGAERMRRRRERRAQSAAERLASLDAPQREQVLGALRTLLDACPLPTGTDRD